MSTEVSHGQVRCSRRGEVVYVITDDGLFNVIRFAGDRSGETIYTVFSMENKESIERDFPIVAKADISISVEV